MEKQEYIKLETLKKQITDNDYNRGAIDMLEMIANKEGWEESETKYFLDFYKNYIMIEKYNQIVEEIVKAYAVRHFKELYELDYLWDQIYIDNIDYKWVNQWPVNISDEYYNLDDIILAEHLQIPCKCLQDYNDRELERHQEGKEKNLYHYWKTKWK